MTVSLFDHCGLGFAFVDNSGILRNANTRFAELLGLASIPSGFSLLSVVDIPPDLSGAISGGGAWRGDLCGCASTARRVFVELLPFQPGTTVEGMGGMLVAREIETGCGPDVPERQWACMKRFAGGLSHEFNNAMAAIQGFAEIAASVESSESPMVKRCLNNILRGCELARESITRARIVGGKADLNASDRDLAALVALWCNSRSDRLPANVQLELDIRGELPPVVIDGQLLEKAFDALWENALQAMEDGGIISVAVQLGGSTRWPTVLEFLDTGCGMLPEVLEHCVEPYFTTREAVGGKGLGLALVHGVAQVHGGRISVDSMQGRGTVVRFWLPASTSSSR